MSLYTDTYYLVDQHTDMNERLKTDGLGVILSASLHDLFRNSLSLKTGKLYSLEYTDIQKSFFTAHYVVHCCTTMTLWSFFDLYNLRSLSRNNALQ
jgi:hypothetical protein